jgi:basic membrane lipoprotein Med (substrate-binding protein (PBP1-ABC) superfamily)
LLATLLAAACSEPSAPTPVAAQAGAEKVLHVGLLTPGSIQDAGWNQSAYEGLLHVRDELGAQIAHQQTSTPAEFEDGFRDLAAQGFQLVFGHGFEFQDAAAKVGAEYPGCVFITTSGSTIRPNVAPIVFELEQATYVLGYVGAKLSKSGKLAAVGGMDIPSVASTFAAFEAGAKAARPDVTVTRAYIGSWEDVAAAKEATLAQIAGGADVLIHNADAAAQGFFQALREQPEGVLGFGTNSDQNELAPERVLASATLDVPQAMLLVAQEVQGGRFKARSIEYGLADGVIGIAWNPALAGKVDGTLRSETEALAERIRSGQLRVERGF